MLKDSRQLAIALARLADKKKAEGIVILNLKKLLFLTDYFVILSGKHKKQNQAIADELMLKAKHSFRVKLLGNEGYAEGSWIVLDFGDVVVHIFHEALRKFYDLEFIWGEATRVRWDNS